MNSNHPHRPANSKGEMMAKIRIDGRTVCKGGERVMELPVAPRAMFADGKVYRQAWIECVPEEPEEEVQGMADLRDDEPEDWCEECFYNGPCGRKDCPVEIEHKATVKRLLKMQKRMDAEDAEAENGLFQ